MNSGFNSLPEVVTEDVEVCGGAPTFKDDDKFVDEAPLCRVSMTLSKDFFGEVVKPLVEAFGEVKFALVECFGEVKLALVEGPGEVKLTLFDAPLGLAVSTSADASPSRSLSFLLKYPENLASIFRRLLTTAISSVIGTIILLVLHHFMLSVLLQ